MVRSASVVGTTLLLAPNKDMVSAVREKKCKLVYTSAEQWYNSTTVAPNKYVVIAIKCKLVHISGT